MLHVVHGRRRSKATPEQVTAGLFVVSLLLLTIGAAVGLRHEAILRHLGTAEGRLVAVELRQEKGGKTPRATVAYEVGGNAVFLTNQRVSRAARDGDPVQVSYDRRDPANGTLRTPEELRAQYLLLIGLGAAFLVAAAVVFGLGMRQAADEPEVPSVVRA